MINSRKEAGFQLKQEGLSSSDHEKAKAQSSSSQWLKLKDPRIVRVSRAFGGKDRHSKVCTIRGLRDRRVRLSVPTAIHLYDLQDRLGLNQPSKVVDWLLNAAKHEIDELPPLPIPPGNFTLGYPSLVSCNQVNTSREGSAQITTWKYSPKCKEVSGDHQMVISNNKENFLMKRNIEEENDNDDKQGSVNNVVANNNLLPRANHHHSSFFGMLNTMPSFGYQWEPNSVDIGQLANHGFVNQTDHIHSVNVVPFPSTLSLSTGNDNAPSHQILVCPSGATTQAYFPSHVAAMEMNPRQINQYQMLSSSGSQNVVTNSLSGSQHLLGQSGKPFSLGRITTTTSPKLFHSPNSSESHDSHKDQDFTCK